MRPPVVLACITILAFATPVSAQQIPDPETFVSGLDFPAGLAFVDEDTLLVNERSGAVRVVEDGSLVEGPIARIPTTTEGETGLLGIAVHPTGEAAFVFATDPDGSHNSIWRIPLGDPGDVRKVVEDLPAAGYHNGGGVAFDRDGMLLVSNGEQHSSDRAQDPNVLGGKVYRFTPDGDVPDDGPYAPSPTLAFGLRNPYGLTIDPETGDAWVTENGPSSFDEVNRVEAGGNYGWPVLNGPGDGSGLQGDYHDPVLAYEDIIVPTGLAFAGPDAKPGVRGDLFFGTFGEGSIHRVRLNADRDAAVSDEVIVRGEQVIGMTWGPGGLYYTTPDSVRFIALAGAPDPEESPTPTQADPTPGRSPSPEADPSSDTNPTGPLAVVILVFLAGGFWLMRQRMGGG